MEAEEFPDFPIFIAHKTLIIGPNPILAGELRPSGAILPLAGKWGPFEDEPEGEHPATPSRIRKSTSWKPCSFFKGRDYRNGREGARFPHR